MVDVSSAATCAPPAVHKPHWGDLFREVAGTDLCAGCGACVVACPRKILAYSNAHTRPYQTDELSGPESCRFGEAGCDTCTRVCARFRADHAAVEVGRFGRTRERSEPMGIELERVALRATRSSGQDGGLVTATLAWALSAGLIDGAVVAGRDPERPLRNVPVILTSPEQVLASSGSRYTYSANLLSLQDAPSSSRLAFVGVPCQVSGLVKGQWAALKRFRPVVFSVALMCSETFEEEAFLTGLLEGTFGLDLEAISKVDVKGRLLVHTDQDDLGHLASGGVPASKVRVREDGVVEIPLREVRPTVRPQCGSCADFSGEWADLSAGGAGMNGWTMAVLRTELAREWVAAMLEAGVLEASDASGFPEACTLLERLATGQRERPAAALAPTA